jgi:hypothetical protein
MFARVQNSLKPRTSPCVQYRGRGEASESAQPDEQEKRTAFNTARVVRALIHPRRELAGHQQPVEDVSRHPLRPNRLTPEIRIRRQLGSVHQVICTELEHAIRTDENVSSIQCAEPRWFVQDSLQGKILMLLDPETETIRQGENKSGRRAAAPAYGSKWNVIGADVFTGLLGTIKLADGFGTNEPRPGVFRCRILLGAAF